MCIAQVIILTLSSSFNESKWSRKRHCVIFTTGIVLHYSFSVCFYTVGWVSRRAYSLSKTLQLQSTKVLWKTCGGLGLTWSNRRTNRWVKGKSYVYCVVITAGFVFMFTVSKYFEFQCSLWICEHRYRVLMHRCAPPCQTCPAANRECCWFCYFYRSSKGDQGSREKTYRH